MLQGRKIILVAWSMDDSHTSTGFCGRKMLFCYHSLPELFMPAEVRIQEGKERTPMHMNPLKCKHIGVCVTDLISCGHSCSAAGLLLWKGHNTWGRFLKEGCRMERIKTSVLGYMEYQKSRICSYIVLCANYIILHIRYNAKNEHSREEKIKK